MIDHGVLPAIAIGGGCVMLLALICIGLWRSRRRAARDQPRVTSFHMSVVDPRIADHGRAAWERTRTEIGPEPEIIDLDLVDVDVEIELDVEPPRMATDRTTIGYAPRRLARGSAPGIPHRIPYTTLPARPRDWDLHAPSVTARMRAARRSS